MQKLVSSTVRSVLYPVSDAFDAFFHEGGTEVEKEAEPLVGQFEIGQELLGVNPGKLFH